MRASASKNYRNLELQQLYNNSSMSSWARRFHSIYKGPSSRLPLPAGANNGPHRGSVKSTYCVISPRLKSLQRDGDCVDWFGLIVFGATLCSEPEARVVVRPHFKTKFHQLLTPCNRTELDGPRFERGTCGFDVHARQTSEIEFVLEERSLRI